MALTITGAKEARAAIQRLIQGAQAASAAGVSIGSALPYAYGMETGRYRRSGRVARKAGGAFYLQGAAREVDRTAKGRLVGALPQGARPTAAAMLDIGGDLVKAARPRAPEKSGKLRGSIYAVPTGRGGR